MTTPPEGPGLGYGAPMRDPSLPPPGWMPDPSRTDLERYWDGDRWTGRIRDRVSKIERVPLEYSQPYAVGGFAPARKRFGFEHVLLITAGLALIGVIGFAGLLPMWPHAWTLAGIQDAQSQARQEQGSQAFGDTSLDGLDLDYPVFGTSDLTLHLAEQMIAHEEAIGIGLGSPGGTASVDEVTDAMYEALAQNPHVFVDSWVMYSSPLLVTVRPEYTYDAEESERRRAATVSALEDLVVESGALYQDSDAARISALHDQIVRHATYDWAAYEAINAGTVGDPVVERSQEAYGIVVEGTAVCTGYAETLQLAAEFMGIESVIVTGTVSDGITSGGHAWNLVLVDGAWRVVDVTWDDAQTATGAEVLQRDYVLLNVNDPLLASRAPGENWVIDGNKGLFE